MLGINGASQGNAPLGSPVGSQTGRLQGGNADLAHGQHRRLRPPGRVAVVVFLKTFYPGDQTVRNASESWARLMFSRDGFSFGRMYEQRFETQVRIDAKDGAIEETKEGYTVQGKIPDRPKFTTELKISDILKDEYNRAGRQKKCYFYVELEEPVLVLHDDGDELRHHLELDAHDLEFEQFKCTYFHGVQRPVNGGSIESGKWEIKIYLPTIQTTLKQEFYR